MAKELTRNGDGRATVLLVDDHEVVRAGLGGLLQQEKDLQVVGEAATGCAAVAMAAELSPDVVVIDMGLPEMNGIDVTRQVLGSGHTPRSSGCRPVRTIGWRRKCCSGATAFLSKMAVHEELIAAIRSSLGRFTASTPVRVQAPAAVSAGKSVFTILSQREREVLQLIAEGKATKQVAGVLNMSVKTAETHRRNLMEKLNMDSVAELTKYAIREGLTSA